VDLILECRMASAGGAQGGAQGVAFEHSLAGWAFELSLACLDRVCENALRNGREKRLWI
jgi:hypothetical protein